MGDGHGGFRIKKFYVFSLFGPFRSTHTHRACHCPLFRGQLTNTANTLTQLDIYTHIYIF